MTRERAAACDLRPNPHHPGRMIGPSTRVGIAERTCDIDIGPHFRCITPLMPASRYRSHPLLGTAE